MLGIRDMRYSTNCEGSIIIRPNHRPYICDDSEDNELLSEASERCAYRKLNNSRTRWTLYRRPSGHRKRKVLRYKLPPTNKYSRQNFENRSCKYSLGKFNTNHCYQHPNNAKPYSFQMNRAVGIIYPYAINDNTQNKSHLKNTTSSHAGKKLNEVTTVFKRECDMSSISTTTDSGMLSSSAKAHRERVNEKPTVKLKHITPESPDSYAETILMEKITPYKKDNTGYFEFVSPSDEYTSNNKVRKHSVHTKCKEERKTKVSRPTSNLQPIQMTILSPVPVKAVTETTRDKKGRKCKNIKLTPIIETKLEQPSKESTLDSGIPKSFHSIIRNKTAANALPTRDGYSGAQMQSEPIHYGYFEVKSKAASHKEDVKKVSFMELDKYPIKINKEIDTKHLMRTTTKDISLATNSYESSNDIKMEDKSLTVHISPSSEHRLSPSVTKMLNELLLDPEHAKIIKKVLHSLARKAEIRRSLSSTILELKAKENKIGILKRKSSASIQNVSNSELDRLHFEKYKTSVDGAIRMLEDRMTRKIYEAVRDRKRRRNYKEEEGQQRDVRTYSEEAENIKGNARHVKYFLQTKSSTDIVTVDSKDLDERSSLPSCKDYHFEKYNSDFSSVNSVEHLTYDYTEIDFAERPYPIEDSITTTFAYNVHVNPPNGNTFKRTQAQDATTGTRIFQPLRNAFSLPPHVDASPVRSGTSHPTDTPANDVANSSQSIGEGVRPGPPAVSSDIPLEEDDIKHNTIPTFSRIPMEGSSPRGNNRLVNKASLGITKSSVRLSSTAFAPLMEDAEGTGEGKDSLVPPAAPRSTDLIKEGVTRTQTETYSTSLRFQDIQVYRSETKKRRNDVKRAKHSERRDSSPTQTDSGYHAGRAPKGGPPHQASDTDTTLQKEQVQQKKDQEQQKKDQVEQKKDQVQQKDSTLSDTKSFEKDTSQSKGYQTDVSVSSELVDSRNSPRRKLSFQSKDEPPPKEKGISPAREYQRDYQKALPQSKEGGKYSQSGKDTDKFSAKPAAQSNKPKDQPESAIVYRCAKDCTHRRVISSHPNNDSDSSSKHTQKKDCGANREDSPKEVVSKEPVQAKQDISKENVTKGVPVQRANEEVANDDNADSTTSTRSKKGTHFAKPDENQIRLPPIRESKESNAMVEGSELVPPDAASINTYGSRYRMSDESKHTYGRSTGSIVERPHQIEEKDKDDKHPRQRAIKHFNVTDTLYRNTKYKDPNPVPDTTSGSPSSDSTGCPGVQKHPREECKPPSAPSSDNSTNPEKTSGGYECKKPIENRPKPRPDNNMNKYEPDVTDCYDEGGCPFYDERDDPEGYDDLPDNYCDYDCCMRCTDCQRMYYCDAMSPKNHTKPAKYSPHDSQDSRPHDPDSHNYNYAGPVYSERIRYTCRRVQGGDGANLISFVVFLILFIGLFQYLNMNIH